MAKIEITELNDKVDQTVSFFGWVDSIRDHGNLVFLDIRDRSGIVQVVVFNKKLIGLATSLVAEDLVKITGKVQKRPEKLVNPNVPTGSIEVGTEDIEVVSKSAPLPFEVNQDTSNINEISRLKYRYLDLRTERMKNNLKARHEINQYIRNYFNEKGFWEIETPDLTKGTPEGAREFIVPSRLHEGKFYVLPQSPQQFKQLLMVAGVEKYYQIARCFRDEDQRGDRQPEFTQLDLEMSFTDREEVLNLIETLMVELVKKIYPEKKILETPFPRITYKESLSKYNSDKPDLRGDDKDKLAFCWVVDFPMFEYSETEEKIVAIHHPFTKPLNEDIAKLKEKPLEAIADTYDLVLNGSEIGGGSMRIHTKELQHAVFEILKLKESEIEDRFGHMLKAFTFSPPPHGGIALGLDRIIAILQDQESIREVIAFPKTGDAKDPLTGAPDEVPEKLLKEDHIKTI